MKKLKEIAGGVPLSKAEQKAIVGGSTNDCLDLNERCLLSDPYLACCPELMCVDDYEEDGLGFCVPIGD